MVKSIVIQINLNTKMFAASFLQEIITQSFGTAHFLFVNRIGFQNHITFQF